MKINLDYDDDYSLEAEGVADQYWFDHFLAGLYESCRSQEKIAILDRTMLITIDQEEIGLEEGILVSFTEWKKDWMGVAYVNKIEFTQKDI